MTVLALKNSHPTDTLTFKELLQQAESLSKLSDPAVYAALWANLAKSGLDGIQTEQILSVMAKTLGCSPKIVRSEYKAVKNKLLNANDVGLQVAKETLEEYYADGLFLKRTPDGCYYCFDKTHWRITSPDVVRGYIQKISSKHLMKTNKTLAALVSDALRCLDDLLASNEDMLGMTEAPPPIINCQNTEVWLGKDGSVELKPHRPASRLFACLGYEYNADATCPVFDKTMLEIFSKTSDAKDMVRHFEEILGYAISGQRHIALFVLMIGYGNNGKSKLLETCQRLIGEHAVLSDSVATFQKDRFNMAALHGKLLFCDDDVKMGITLNDEMIKKLSESKLVSARHPYGKKKFTFRQLAMPILSSNGYPNTDDISTGMMRRAYVIPFDRQFTPDEDNKALFPQIWETEMSGVLNRAIQGLQRLIERGGFLEPEDCVKARQDFFAHANPLYAFFKDCTLKDPDAEMTVKKFRETYAFWAKEQGLTIQIQTKKFVRVLRGLQNEFGFKVTEPKGMDKAAYPKIQYRHSSTLY